MNLRKIIIIIIALGITTGCSEPINGKVIDAETGQPIEGAVVLVEWTRKCGIGDYRTDSVRVVETATNKEGMFRVPPGLTPFAEPPHLTIYKKGYVAWNNGFIFPDYKHRKQNVEIYGHIRLENFKETYSYDQHVSFLRTCTNWALADHKKRKFEAAYQWEVALARKEVLREK